MDSGSEKGGGSGSRRSVVVLLVVVVVVVVFVVVVAMLVVSGSKATASSCSNFRHLFCSQHHRHNRHDHHCHRNGQQSSRGICHEIFKRHCKPCNCFGLFSSSWAIHVVALMVKKVKKDKKMAKSMVQMMDARRGQGFDQGLALAVLT